MKRKNTAPVDSKTFARLFGNSHEVLIVAQQFCAHEGYASLQNLCDRNPEIVRSYCYYAHAALRGLKKLHDKQRRDAERRTRG